MTVSQCLLIVHSVVQIRNQRNCFAALIATARQAAAEMTDRMRLLSSEQEILTAEVATKAQLLDKVGLHSTSLGSSLS